MSYYRLEYDDAALMLEGDVVTRDNDIAINSWLTTEIYDFKHSDYGCLKITGYAGYPMGELFSELDSEWTDENDVTFWRHVDGTPTLPGKHDRLVFWMSGYSSTEMLMSNSTPHRRGRLPMNRLYSEPLPIP